MAEPTVSVVMTTFNGTPLITQSIDSLLVQTWHDFELIVVDDCSTNDTVARLERYADPRLRIVRNPTNLGIVGSRNLGFSLARGRYLAALDHDDISMPDRLERQVAYLDAHPEIVLVGSRWLNLTRGVTRPDPYDMTEPLLVRWALYLSNVMCYSSIMVRTECLRRLAPPMRQERILSDDFDLYHRLLPMGGIARLPEPLIIYRIHGNNTFRHRMQEMQGNAILVLTDAYAPWFGPQARDVAELMTRLVAVREIAGTDEELRRLRAYLDRLARCFIEANAPPPAVVAAIEASVTEVWTMALRRRVRAGGLSSLRHLGPPWKAAGAQRIALLETVFAGLIPGKRLMRETMNAVAARLPTKLSQPWFAHDDRGAPWPGLRAPAWEGFTLALAAIVCLPLLAIIRARAALRGRAARARTR